MKKSMFIFMAIILFPFLGIALNNSPVASSDTAFLNENSAIATSALTVIASDHDVADILPHSILPGKANNAFVISSTTGEKTVQSSVELNFETGKLLMLSVKVEDKGSSVSSDTVCIIIFLKIAGDETLDYSSDGVLAISI